MRKIIHFFVLFTGLLLSANTLKAIDWTIDVIVAQDGTGDFTTISDAIDSCKNDGSNFVIFIKNGTYDENIKIAKNNITLLGEDRDSTIITQAILRSTYYEANGSDWGVATINIDDDVVGLTLANLTVQNNYADVYPDDEDNHGHTMTIRGSGDKVIIVNCNILSTGGDTLSLWNTDGGRFYHSGCFFNGYVDYVCPRGYCYIDDCDFYGYNSSASIWHDGSGGKDHKFVVKNSWFDGVEDFALGRYHRMAAFYLLDCDFSKNMKDQEIQYVGDSTDEGDDEGDYLYYGERVYYDRCWKEDGNYSWFADNLDDADGSPERDTITDTWTFNDTWNPEVEIAGLLECSFLPSPGYRAKEVSDTPVLSWMPGKNASKHLVYFGDSEEPEFAQMVTDTFFTVTGTLESATQYYWHVDEITSDGDTIIGKTWSFFTDVTEKPAKAYSPFPPLDTNMTSLRVNFSWSSYIFEVDTFDFYLGGENNLDYIGSTIEPAYMVKGMDGDTTYYWRVDSRNKVGTTEGDIWYYDYKKSTNTSITGIISQDGEFRVYPNPVKDKITIGFSLDQSQNISIEINSLEGRVIYSKDLGIIASGENNYTVDLTSVYSNMNNSICLLSVLHNGKKEVFKLYVQ